MNRKITLGLLSAGLLFLGGCSNETQEENEVDSANNTTDDSTLQEVSSEELSGEIEFMTISLSPTFDDYFKDVIEDFEDIYPDVSVVVRDIPIDQVEQVVLTSASSGDLPDVMNLNTDFVKKIGALGALVDMDEVASDVKSEYYEGLWDAAEVNGSVYALPWYTAVDVLIYNPDILEAAGYDAPPTTMDEAWEMSAKIVEETGAYGQVLSPTYYSLLPQNGINYLNEEGTEAAFNTPEAVELLTTLKGYYDEGLFPIEVALDQVAMAELYAQEEVAWWSTGSQLFRQIDDLSPDVFEKSLAAPSILGSAGSYAADIMNIAVSSSSEAEAAAVEFAKFLTNAENQLEFSKLANTLPSIIAAGEDEHFLANEDAEDVSLQGNYYAAEALHLAENMIPSVENVTQVYDAIKIAFESVLLEGADPSGALTEAETAVNQLLAE